MLRSVTPRQRAPLVLLDMYGFSSAEAARIMGIRLSTVRALATQGRAVLRISGARMPETSPNRPRGAEAIIYWSRFPDGNYADPYGQTPIPAPTCCARRLVPRPPISRQRCRRRPGPSSSRGLRTLGGYPARHVVLAVRNNVDCDPGFFFSWRDRRIGALWTTTGVGATIRCGSSMWTERASSSKPRDQTSQLRSREGDPAIRQIDSLRLVRSTHAASAGLLPLSSRRRTSAPT
jgi:hypothetical protein